MMFDELSDLTKPGDIAELLGFSSARDAAASRRKIIERLVHQAGASLAAPTEIFVSAKGLAARYPAVICVPACNEESRLGACIAALNAQNDVSHDDICLVILINNSTDRTFDVVRRRAASSKLPLIALHVTFPDDRANAGHARRLAMDIGLSMTAPYGHLLTTDADSCPTPNWLAVNLALLREGYDGVCGQVQPDPLEMEGLPDVIHLRGLIEWRYERASMALGAALDPDPDNPWPHHGRAAGASLAVTASAYRAVGRLPTLAVSEDRAFVQRLKRASMRVCHSSDAVVIVSCRLQGRAYGGMADALATRINDPDAYCDEMLEPAKPTWLRAQARGRLRRAVHSGGIRSAINGLGLSLSEVEMIEQAGSFGEAWALAEQFSPTLVRRPIRPSEVDQELPLLLTALEKVSQQPAINGRCDRMVDASV